MIDTKTQLEGTLDQIAWASDALEGLRRTVDEQNVRVFPVIAEAYISHIRAMTAEARTYVNTLLDMPPNLAGSGSNGFAAHEEEFHHPAEKVA